MKERIVETVIVLSAEIETAERAAALVGNQQDSVLAFRVRPSSAWRCEGRKFHAGRSISPEREETHRETAARHNRAVVERRPGIAAIALPAQRIDADKLLQTAAS